MQTTMDLLDKALELHPAPYWHKKLGLTRTVLHTAKFRGNLSPAIAGALAEELGEAAEKWIVIAALESERESACKSRMVRKFITGAALAGALASASGAATAAVASISQNCDSMYIMLNRFCR
ncbi:hypothetical protein [Comamonas sp. NoAH]|uniref:hypothetical protein n=1 Tax=Comamonas halotolerans TaxID=3041496 RepID=UPI0024E05BE7|nr:hypothetical protein [Comamonas sp. NoAH]